MYFSFGALADKFSEQCEEQGYKLNNADKWDKLVHCTIMLYIHNVLTDSRYDECLNRILKMYKKELVRLVDQSKSSIMAVYLMIFASGKWIM